MVLRYFIYWLMSCDGFKLFSLPSMSLQYRGYRGAAGSFLMKKLKACKLPNIFGHSIITKMVYALGPLTSIVESILN